jgi:hypothetical protein
MSTHVGASRIRALLTGSDRVRWAELRTDEDRVAGARPRVRETPVLDDVLDVVLTIARYAWPIALAVAVVSWREWRKRRPP